MNVARELEIILHVIAESTILGAGMALFVTLVVVAAIWAWRGLGRKRRR
jgi:hypothetical protein